MMRWKRERIFTSKTLTGKWVGLEEIDDGIWSLYYGPVLLARFDEREMRFCDSMADAQPLYCLRKDDPSQVVPVRDRTSAHRIDTVCSCELNGRLSLRVFGRSAHESPVSATPQPSPGVTYVPGLFCHPCSRPHARVSRRRYTT